MLPEDYFKLIQCYHCMTLADHLKNDCPEKDEPAICGRCGATDHQARVCSRRPYCVLCGQYGHPATARVCPIYRTKYSEKLNALKNKFNPVVDFDAFI